MQTPVGRDLSIGAVYGLAIKAAKRPKSPTPADSVRYRMSDSTSSEPASEATMIGLADWPYAGGVMSAARAVKARVIDASTA